MPNGKQEKQANSNKKKQGKQLTRREALGTLGAVTAIVPLGSLLWQGGAGVQAIELDKGQVGKLVDKVLFDPEFRKKIKANPVEVLAQAGIKLPPEATEALTKAMKQDDNPLRKMAYRLPAPIQIYYPPAALKERSASSKLIWSQLREKVVTPA